MKQQEERLFMRFTAFSITTFVACRLYFFLRGTVGSYWADRALWTLLRTLALTAEKSSAVPFALYKYR